MKILITGAGGVIGRVLTEGLASTHRLVLVDRRPLAGIEDAAFQRVAAAHTYVQLDLANERETRALLVGEKPAALIHLAAVMGKSLPWEDVLQSNIVGSVNVLEASVLAETQRLVYASTNNVYGGYEEEAVRSGAPLHLQASPRMLTETAEPRPDSRYAVSKLMLEDYATYLSRHHHLRSFGLRIGTVREVDDPERGERELRPRFRTTWLYHTDLIALVHLCLSTTHEGGIFNAISGLPGARGVFIDVTKAMQELGYLKGTPGPSP